jgi:carbon-monoxide dehydrogenase small subunit
MADITLRVNGAARTGSPEARKTLADFLRDDLDLTGTHVGCEHGVCGACTVIVDGRAVRSCLMQATAFLSGHPDAGEQEIREALSGNICRCTGYQSIIDGVLLAAERNRER